MRLLWVLLGPVLASPAIPQEEDPEAARIARLVERLGSEDYREREAADRELRRLGDKAVPELEKALRSDDLEVRERAKEILRDIRTRTRVQEPKADTEQEEPVPERLGSVTIRVHVVVGSDEDYELQLGPNGKVRLRLLEAGRVLEEASAEEFRKKFPEEYEKYVRPHTRSIRLGRPPAREDLPRWEPEEMRELEKMLRELEKWFERWEKDDWADRWLRRFREHMPWREEDEAREPEDEGPERVGFVIRPVDPEKAEAAGLEPGEGVEILRVYDNTPASRIGLREGDILLTVNGRTVRNAVQARVEFSRALTGDEVRLQILRDGKREELKAGSAELRR